MGECALAGRLESDWQNQGPKGQDQMMAKTLEIISRGITNSNRLKRDWQIINYNI